MYDKKKGLLVGFFVLGALLILVSGLVVFGAMSWFKQSARFVAFFDGSVKGLKPGAAVLFRGVRIGEVVEVNLQVDHEGQEVRIPVIFEIYPQAVLERGRRPSEHDTILAVMIKQGLRAQLETESFVTGILAINLDFHPSTAPKLIGKMEEYTEIPAIPSRLQQLSDLLESLPLGEFVAEARQVVSQASDILGSSEIREIIHNMGQIVGDLQKTIHSTSELLSKGEDSFGPLTDDIRRVVQDAGDAVERMNNMFGSLERVLSEDSPTFVQVNRTLESMQEAADEVRELSDLLDRKPESLLLGK